MAPPLPALERFFGRSAIGENIGPQHLVHWTRIAYSSDADEAMGDFSRTALPLEGPLPQAPSEHPDFWAIWRRALLAVLPGPPDRVFTSDPYGAELAATLGARWIPVDPDRVARPISGTAIRAAPLACWDHLPRPVRPYFVRRVSVFGPESTGKTTLAAHLAALHRTAWVPEYARAYLEARPDPAARRPWNLASPKREGRRARTRTRRRWDRRARRAHLPRHPIPGRRR